MLVEPATPYMLLSPPQFFVRELTRPVRRLLAVDLWETTTVAEIRQQAVEFAQYLARQLGSAGRHSKPLKRAV